ncbi:HNH endonuclease [Agathobaculum butyriciproducens]|nr:HNH endonuclease [Agathobaculum butyriciproducens]RGC60917.1 HNH endonuclease [Agathobaculum butyriciproducens]
MSFYNNNNTTITIIIAVTFFLSVLITHSIFSTFQHHKMMKIVSRIADDIGYTKERDECMTYLFGTKQHYLQLNTSATLVANFNTFKYLDYLVKYFGLSISKESIIYLKKLFVITETFVATVSSQNIPIDYTYIHLPTFVMAYTSPGGRSHTQTKLIFNLSTLQQIQAKISTLTTKKDFFKRERSKMTASLKKRILERDNYTCQQCGNSVYKEPNLLLEIDHIIPVSKGGTSEPQNLQTLCWRCNRSKSDKL